jgi:geranylgeranyl pyrophosphate synthase
MASKMVQAEATKNTGINVDTLMNMLGRYYQIRDDYQDIIGAVRLSLFQYMIHLSNFVLKSVGKSTHYNDLDQGSFTLPIIHALKFQDERGITELLSIFQSRRQTNGMSPDLKKLVIKRLEEAGSLEYTKGVLEGLYEELKQELSAVEERTGEKNWILRLMLHRLKV